MKNILLAAVVTAGLMTSVLFGADGAMGTVFEFFGSRWKTILGVLVTLGGGFYVPMVRTLLLIAVKSVMSGPVIKRFVIEKMRDYAKSTETEVDDDFVDEFERRVSKIKSF